MLLLLLQGSDQGVYGDRAEAEAEAEGISTGSGEGRHRGGGEHGEGVKFCGTAEDLIYICGEEEVREEWRWRLRACRE